MRHEILDTLNGAVINIIEADEDFCAANFEFYREVPEVAAAPTPINEWWIYVGPFYDRFGALKIPILASADPVVQAIIKDAGVRKFIDLQRDDLAQALDIIISKGFAINKAAILTTPVAVDERFVG